MHRVAALILGVALAIGLAEVAGGNEIVVNRDTGRIFWRNPTEQPLDIAAYTLRSLSGGFRPKGWLSITGHYDADSGGGLDMEDTWFLLGSDALNLSEATLGATSLDAGAMVDLGLAWTPLSDEDVTFDYLDVLSDEVVPGIVQFISVITGDYNGNGVVEQADLDLVLLNWGEPALPLPPGWINDVPLGRIDQQELDGVLLNWGAGGAGSAQPSLHALFGASVPEPATFGGLAIMMVVALRGLGILRENVA